MMDQNALVSIIVPVYGTEAYLPSCIESISNQTYKNLQIILIDDQSFDKCPEICDRYAKADDRILVIHQENKGVSGARNTGLRNAVGDYIIFVDSDDELYPDAVSLLMKDASKYGADIVSAKKRTVKNEPKDMGSSRDDGGVAVYRGDESLLLSLAGNSNTNSSCAKLFKASVINGCFFEEGKNINEDIFFVFQCFLKEPVTVQHDIYVYRYNVVENSNSRQSFSEKYFSMLYFCEKKKKIIEEKYPEYIDQARNMEVRTHLQFLDVLCRTHDKKYKHIQKESISTVKKLKKYHTPINSHHKKLEWIVAHGLYPLYKLFYRLRSVLKGRY